MLSQTAHALHDAGRLSLSRPLPLWVQRRRRQRPRCRAGARGSERLNCAAAYGSNVLSLARKPFLWIQAQVKATFIALFSILLVSGCAVGPDYSRPSAPVPSGFKEMEGWKQAEPRDQEIKGKWWEIYSDPVLGGLIEQVSVSNQTLAQSEAQFRQARALVAQARAAYFPVLNASGSITRSRGSGNSDPNTITLRRTTTEHTDRSRCIVGARSVGPGPAERRSERGE